MFDMMGKVKDLQARVAEAKARLAQTTHTAEAGAGLVKVTVTGAKLVQKITIDQTIIKPEDAELLADLIVAATNKALNEIDVIAKAEIKKSTEGIIPNIPGLDLFNGLM